MDMIMKPHLLIQILQKKKKKKLQEHLSIVQILVGIVNN
nr:MAG TPA: hypothetical protein [Caudoviricetes sp.]